MKDGIDLEPFAVFPLLLAAVTKVSSIVFTTGRGFNKPGYMDKLAGKVVRTMHPMGYLVCCRRK
jgi:hypothetical protein